MLNYITLPESALPNVAPYSHAVRAGDFLFLSGQLAEDPATGKVVRGPIDEQTTRVMENLKLVLEHCGSSLDNVVMARIFLTDFREFDTVNQVYRSYFKPDRLPGRTTIGTIALADYGDIEIDVIAYCGDAD
ncbi:MAG: RidA family protein [Kaiparowitsia implicata GSE-PSE-MK54-09C]|nr:RidA family protein [Kaiparowitsia implicata GSE-PSE-MK54-09C]